MQIFSFSPFGYEGALVTVEVDLRRGIPAIDMVGLADGAVRESRERMRAAIRNSGFDFPCERVLISLSPADVKKEGAGFDLAIALAVLLAARDEPSPAQEGGRPPPGRHPAGGAPPPTPGGAQQAPKPPPSPAANGGILVMGELELTGKIRAVRGTHAAVSSAAEQGVMRCIVPAQNAPEAASCGVAVCAVETLAQAYEACFDAGKFSPPPPAAPGLHEAVEFPPVPADGDFSTLKNQGALARALQIAAAGRHHVLAFGPPGSGKTLALSRFHALLPYLTAQEARPVSRIYSLAAHSLASGDVPRDARAAPFRSPHQSSSPEGMTGGGRQCSPGEISLAHNGVLFLDEILEFKQHVLQSLRVPLETGSVTVSRAGRSSVYPARFVLLAAANPCPCGNFGARGKICLCSPRSVEQYWKKLAGPLLDRIDMRIPVFPQGQFSDERYAPQAYSTESLREGIARATAVQRGRQRAYNGALTPEEITAFCPLTDSARAALDKAALLYGFTSRSVALCKKIARTIADMEQRAVIDAAHIEEAVFFRKNEGGVSLGMIG